VLDAIEGISTHRLLDRLIRGRLWIGLVTFALIGIVTLQLGLLKLNSGIGHSLESQALLQRENSALSIENSELASGDRVEEQAKRLGMTLAKEEDLRFLASHPRPDALHAATALQNPVQREAPASANGTESQPAAGESEAQQSTAGSAEAGATQAPEGTGAGTEATGGEATRSEATTGEAAATGAAATQTTTTGTAPSEDASANGGTQAAPAG
jgi:cell division protein FtsL